VYFLIERNRSQDDGTAPLRTLYVCVGTQTPEWRTLDDLDMLASASVALAPRQRHVTKYANRMVGIHVVELIVTSRLTQVMEYRQGDFNVLENDRCHRRCLYRQDRTHQLWKSVRGTSEEPQSVVHELPVGPWSTAKTDLERLMRYSLSKHALVESSTLNPGRRSGEQSDKGARRLRQCGNRVTMLLNVKTRRVKVLRIADGKVVIGMA
jgi:hypothetical protein